MKLLIDVMSTDRTPDELLRGACEAASDCGVLLALIGNVALLEERVQALGLLVPENVSFIEAPSVVQMDDEPLCVVRDKSDSSMAVGLRLLAEGKGDALVSAGNTGALLAGASLLVRRIKGIGRAAIAAVLPLAHPTLLLDCGAHTEVTAAHLEQFALMGTVYMKRIYECDEVSVGLLNNGTEERKGAPLQKEAYARLRANPNIRFYGNVEGHDILQSPCDVLVTDGFTGNVVLKLCEGFGRYLRDSLVPSGRSLLARATDRLTQARLQPLLSTFDPSVLGGAPLLGISRPIIKAHGASDAHAFAQAIRSAIRYVHAGVIADIAKITTQSGEATS